MAPHESHIGHEAHPLFDFQRNGALPRGPLHAAAFAAHPHAARRAPARGARLALAARCSAALLPGQCLASAALLLRPSRVARPRFSLAFTVLSLSAFMVGASPNVALMNKTATLSSLFLANAASFAVDNITTC